MEHGPLHNVRVTEFTSAWAGPYATCLLGFLGAEVIKVESMGRLDHSRLTAFSTGKNFTTPNESSVFNSINLNKKSVTLNLKQPKAIEMAKELVKKSDVVVENMRPGVMPRLGLGYEALSEVRPDLIYLSSSACGQTGPDTAFVGYAPNFASIGGVSYNTGYEDWPPSNLMGFIDLKSATTSAFAILMALIYRQNTGEGQYIDLASQECIATLNSDILLEYILNQRVPGRHGNRDDIMAPHNCYPCQGEDKWISIAVKSNEEWQACCKVMGKPELAEDPRFVDNYVRWNNQTELDTIIGEWTKDFDAGELMQLFQKEGVAATPSYNAEGLFEDPHLKERGVFQEVDHPVMEKDYVIAPPWRLSETPAAVRRHAPNLGEDNEYVFCEMLGMSKSEIEALIEEKVVF